MAPKAEPLRLQASPLPIEEPPVVVGAGELMFVALPTQLFLQLTRIAEKRGLSLAEFMSSALTKAIEQESK